MRALGLFTGMRWTIGARGSSGDSLLDGLQGRLVGEVQELI
jgi:hypothetical protein